MGIIHLLLACILCSWVAAAQPAAERSVLEVVPTLAELGSGWTTNTLLSLLDPRSRPPAASSGKPLKSATNTVRRTRRPGHQTGWIRLEYGRGDMLLNKGAYFVSVQRWANTNALNQAWQGWAARPDYTAWRGLPLGESCYWTEDDKFHGLVFRRGLYHVVVTCGERSPAAPFQSPKARGLNPAFRYRRSRWKNQAFPDSQ
jgi:hypothetical protein